MKCIYCKDTKKLNGKFECWYCKPLPNTQMAQQTAVQWLQRQLNENYEISEVDIEQALQMEEQKAFEIFKAGQNSMEEGGKSFEQYYNKTFKND